MDESKDQLRRLAIAVEELASMLLERFEHQDLYIKARLEAQVQAPAKTAPSNVRYWLQYVLGPIVLGVVSHLLSHVTIK